MSPLAIIGAVGGAVKIGKILWNAGKVIRFFRTFSKIGKDLITQRRFPNCTESKEFLGAAKDLLEAGVIDIPGVDESALVKAIVEIEQEIVCKAA